MHGVLIDQIYEAAFRPECWTNVLESVGAVANSDAGLLVVFNDIKPVQYRATPPLQEVMRSFCETHWRESRRAAHTLKNPFTGFRRLSEYFPAELLRIDPSRANRISAGLDSEVSAAISMPTGELVVYSFDRWSRHGLHENSDIDVLDSFYPHLARAGLMSARLGLERAVATTDTLQRLGLPAAVLTDAAKVVSTNSLFDGLPDLFQQGAFGRLAMFQEPANELLCQAVEGVIAGKRAVYSIPIRESEARRACVVHVVPLRRSAYDLFPGGSMVIAVSTITKSALVTNPDILTGLFDLTPAEAKFAAALVAGRSVKTASSVVGITENSGRTYLARIFTKTGTHRQAELVALLTAAHPFS